MSTPVYEIGFTQSFWSSFALFDEKTRKHVHDAIDKLCDGHPSVDVHKLQGLEFVAFGVNQDGLRVICHRQGATLVLCHVGKHDPAYEWAKRNRLVQVGHIIRLIRTVEEVESPTLGSKGAEQLAAPMGPLATIPIETFARFEVNAPTARTLKSVADEDALIDLLEHFPSCRSDALIGLSIDSADADTLAVKYAAAKATAPSAKSVSFADALRDEANSAEVWLASPDDEAVKKALQGGLASWRAFLHPAQRRIVRTDAKGALKVGGGPGTGKTVVALHRARWLAEKVFAPELPSSGGAATSPLPILVTTFNNVLAKTLEPMLDELCADAPAARARITVLSTTRAAQELLKIARRPNRLLTDVEDAWTKALAQDVASRGKRFYESERTHVLARHDAWTEKAYLEAPRTGRATRLDRAKRKAIWQVLEAFDAALSAQGGGDDLALARDAAALITTGMLASPYAAVVCDEAQDLGAADLRLLAALARDPQTGTLRHNALTLCGDAYQRLYRAPVPLSACGIDVRGRAKNLKLNYRSTDAIRSAAVKLLQGKHPEEAEDTDTSTLDGYRALRRGTAPEEHTFATAEAEADWIGTLATPPTKGDSKKGTLLVLARTHDWLDALKNLLVARGHTPRVLGPNDLPSDTDTFVLCTLHRAKGLEAPRVVIAGRQLVPMKYPGGGDPADRTAWDAKEIASLYVGVTRARDWCGVSSVGSR